jgi:hypothetical protein
MTQDIAAAQVLNTKGAARRLGCSETWVQKLVSAGKLVAYIYDQNGLLTQHQPGQRRQGQGLYFLTSDVDAYQPVVQRRPRGSKNKKPLQNIRTA